MGELVAIDGGRSWRARRHRFIALLKRAPWTTWKLSWKLFWLWLLFLFVSPLVRCTVDSAAVLAR